LNRPLSDPVPLRDTSAWPGFDSIEIIPRVYGRAKVKPLRYSEAGTVFVVADHAVEAVDSVTLDGESVAFQWWNGSDVSGHACAFVALPEAPDTGARLAAEVRGLSGNPADIVADLYPAADLSDFGAHCRNAGLALGGALTERMTVRAAVQFVLGQVGAVWSAGLPGFARPFPPADDGPIWASFGALDVAGWSAECSLDRIVTRLAVQFDFDAVEGKHRQSLTLEAPASSARHGVREADLALPWVRDARQGAETATAHLQWRARPLWRVQFSAGVQYRDLQPGGWVSLSTPRLPMPGLYVVTDFDPGLGRGSVTVTAEAPAGFGPAVAIVGQASAFEPIRTEYALQAGGDTATLTVTDETGQKLPGSKVWIDGKGPVTADATAKVRFPATPGKHVLRIEADGRRSITTEVQI